MWIARDMNGSLWLYDTKPTKGIYGWSLDDIRRCCEIDGDLDGFEDIKWEDENPRELVLKPIKEE